MEMPTSGSADKVITSPALPEGGGNLRQRIKAKLRFVRVLLRASVDFLSDFWRYCRYSASSGLNNKDQVNAKITATFHNIEKGLSLPSPRLGFGRDNLELLISLLHTPGLDLRGHPASTAIDVLAAYARFNETHGKLDYPFHEEIATLQTMRAERNAALTGGLRHVTRETVRKATAGVGDDFFLERHSIRQFSGEPVDLALVERAIALAQKAPAVCNRQVGSVYVIADKQKKRELLDFQGGSRGFSDQIDVVLVVTSRLSNFWGNGERNQVWVDGGLYAMSLIYALHAKGLGSVSLNWSRTTKDSAKLRAMLNMDDDQVTIMMIGVGNLKEEFDVPISQRRDPGFSYRMI